MNGIEPVVEILLVPVIDTSQQPFALFETVALKDTPMLAILPVLRDYFARFVPVPCIDNGFTASLTAVFETVFYWALH